MPGRGCRRGCGFCLLGPLVLLVLAALAYHALVTPPAYAAVTPSSPQTLSASMAVAVGQAYATRRPVAVLQLSDQEVTALVDAAVGTGFPLGRLQVHVLAGRLLVLGTTRVWGQLVVVGGQLRLRPLGGTRLGVRLVGVSLGQLGLPAFTASVLARLIPGQLSLPASTDRIPLRVECVVARPGWLSVAVRVGSGAAAPAGICAGSA